MTPHVHGTYAGYQTHKRHNNEPCDDCRAANAAYVRRYRRSKPEAAEYVRKQHEAYRAAQARLRALHYPEFNLIYDEELRARGLRPDGAS